MPTPNPTFDVTDPDYLSEVKRQSTAAVASSMAATDIAKAATGQAVSSITNATAQASIAVGVNAQVQAIRENTIAVSKAFAAVPAYVRLNTEHLTILAWMSLAEGGNSTPNAVTLAMAQVAEFRKTFPAPRPSASGPA